ncbi:MAG: hypothetical protein JW951_04270, partial [Lentisphaerae bacterium]|nr:hypothetical protein [Lentisphaerota bacterium]
MTGTRRIGARMRAVLLILSAGCLSPGAAEGTARGEGPYPAEVSAWTEAEREAQREAGAALAARLVQAGSNGQARVEIARGHYRFGRLGDGPRPAHLYLRDLHGLTVDFRGSTLWFERQAGALLIQRCDALV